MLKSYKFVETEHQKLHEFVIAFFNRVESESGKFSLDFFEAEFRTIVKRHKKILKVAFEEIYNEIKDWDQESKSDLCEVIRQSNDIANICSRQIIPRTFIDSDADIYKKIRTLFLKLYSDVVNGAPVHEEWGITLRHHFDAFRIANDGITLCPMCGISELKTEYDTTRDQYDHYLPKALYPLSSVNFYNLVPICKECNSFDAKGEKDILALTTNRLFYPYDDTHQGINVDFSILCDSANVEEIDWQVTLVSPAGKFQEVNAWKEIYNIEYRYIGFVKGRIKKWYRAYWQYLKDDTLIDLTEEQKSAAYFASLKADDAECLNIIRKPAISEFISKCSMAKAAQEAEFYS